MKRVQDSSAAGAALAKAGLAPGCCGRKLGVIMHLEASSALTTAAVPVTVSIPSNAATDAPHAPIDAPHTRDDGRGNNSVAKCATAAVSESTSTVAVRSAWDLDGDGVVEASEIAARVKQKAREKTIMWRNKLELAVVHFFEPIFA
jgi:hypothetical protein